MARKQGKRKRRTGLIWTLVIAVVLFGIFAMVLLGGEKAENEVYVEPAVQRTVVASVSESGTIEPVTEVKVAADVSGEVIRLEAREGQQVKQGDIMVEIRPDNYQSALEQAKAALNSAIAAELNAQAALEQARVQLLQDSASHVRNDQLLKGKVIARAEWETTKLRYDIARSQVKGAIASLRSSRFQVDSRRASLKNAQTELRKTTIVASMSGTITQQNVQPGERVVGTVQMQGTELFRIADLSRMRVVVDINENDIVHIHIGDSAQIELDAFEERTFNGSVTEIAYSASDDALGSDQITSFEVKVEIDPASYQQYPEVMRGLNPNESPFRPGMSAQVEIFTEQVPNAVAVPIQAVTVRKPEGDDEAEAEEVVFIIDEQKKVKKLPVTTGISDDKYIVISEGLSPGQQVITGPYRMLSKTLKADFPVKVISDPRVIRQKEKAAEKE